MASRMATLNTLSLLLAINMLSSPIWSFGRKTVLRSGNLSCNDKQLIVSQHNQLRQRVAVGHARGQPSASNMREMVWDEELARIAQNWANQCTVAHNTPRSARFHVGENIAATWTYGHQSPSGPAPDFRKCISDWYGEVSIFPGNNVGHYQFSHSTGHYSQMVWGDTYLVGCGYSYFLDPEKGYTKFYVCNYGPAGNIIGGQIYKPGPPNCPAYRMSSSYRYPGLCEVPGSNPPGPVCLSSNTGYYAQPTQHHHRPSTGFYTPPRHHQHLQHFFTHPFYLGR